MFSTYDYNAAGHFQASIQYYMHNGIPTLPHFHQQLQYTCDHIYHFDFHMGLMLWKINTWHDTTEIEKDSIKLKTRYMEKIWELFYNWKFYVPFNNSYTDIYITN
jgi:hypothetical protein